MNALAQDSNEAYRFIRAVWLHLLCTSTVVGLFCIGSVGKIYLWDHASLVIMKQATSDSSDYQAEEMGRRRK